MKKVLIVGGGFGGIAAALELEKQLLSDVKITLVSNKPHFEYTAALYRVVTGKSPLQVCVPLSEIFRGKNIESVTDVIIGINFEKKIAQSQSGSRYQFDFLILALGSQTAYFNIPGLEKFAFGFKSITEALRLKRHLHELFVKASKLETSQDEKVSLLHFVVVGAGASGVELAGELTIYAKTLAKNHQVDSSLITIDLIEGAGRVMPVFPSAISAKIEKRLRSLGINIFTNRPIIAEKLSKVEVRGMTLFSNTVIWTAGVQPNSLYKKISEFKFDKKGRILVDDYLRAQGLENIFIIGDSASTLHAGMAQTASYDGKFVARHIASLLQDKKLANYQPQKPYYSIPIGPGWAVTLIDGIAIYGRWGWLLRRLADLRYFLSILPISKAILAWRVDKTLCETCQICLPENNNELQSLF
ncbi:MAG: NAD(P)/FAD-dependent oxidoreductase [Parcubacteria group bacterium]|nr:NAD(P)/FAD-dependent oxidoreductase [Parcubacteria group bacterium]